MNQALLKYTAHVGSAALSFGPYCGTEVDYLSVFRFFFLQSVLLVMCRGRCVIRITKGS